MTADRDRLEEQESEAYQALFDQIHDEQYAEFRAEFGEEYRITHPWEMNGRAIHEEVLRRMAAAREASKD